MGNLSTVRQALSTAVEALEGWHVSRFAPEMFGRDPDPGMHHSFAVGTPSSTVQSGQRQRISEGMLVETICEVHWAHAFRGDAQVSDYDAMLDAEQTLVQALRGADTHSLSIVSMTRRAGPEGYVIGLVRVMVRHPYALSTGD